MTIVTKIVNYISVHALAKWKFTNLLNEVDCQFSGLLHNSRWLSHGHVLNQLWLLEEIRLTEKGHEFRELTDIKWLNDNFFFMDFSFHYNNFNEKLQDSGCVVPSCFGQIKRFWNKARNILQRSGNKSKKIFSIIRKVHFSVFQLRMLEVKQQVFIHNNVQILLSERPSKFQELNYTLQFIQIHHIIQLQDQLNKFDWLDLSNLEMVLIDFQ